MREILFRGKPLGYIDNAFIYGSLGVISTDLVAIYQCKEFAEDDITLVDIGTVGQYTGLTDKNGKKIFEGDILKGKHTWHNYNTRFGGDEKDFFEQKIRGAYGKHKSEEYAMFEKDRFFYFRNYVVEYYVPWGGYRAINGGQFYSLTQNFVYNRDAEIIGNIHDNPELLKGGEG